MGSSHRSAVYHATMARTGSAFSYLITAPRRPWSRSCSLKLMLFQTLYHHHKVRAVDCMIKGIVEYIRNHHIPLDFGDAHGLGLRRATDFLWLTDDVFFTLAYLIKDDRLHRLLHNLRYRRLLKRALVICKDSIKKDDLPYFLDLRQLARKRDVEDQSRLRHIALEIWKRSGRCCSRYEVWLDVPTPPSGREADLAFVRPAQGAGEQGEALFPLSQSFPARTWADMYWLHKYRVHVFSPPDCVHRVAKAAKEVIETEFNLRLNSQAHEMCHIELPDHAS